MQYLERLKEEKNLKGLIHEADRISEIVSEYQFRLVDPLKTAKKVDDIQRIIKENLIKLDLITEYKKEVSKILGQPYNKVLH